MSATNPNKITCPNRRASMRLWAWHTNAPVPPDEDKLKECYQLLLHHLLRDLSQIRIPRGSAGAGKLKDWLL